jgi:hypothetical protein
MVVDKPDEALKALKVTLCGGYYRYVAIEVTTDPGGLAGILKVLNDNGINLEYMYDFVEKNADNAISGIPVR